MNMFFNLKKFFHKQVPLPISIAIDTLREAQEIFDEPVFNNEIKVRIEKIIEINQDKFLELFKANKKMSPREWVIAQISNLSGDLLETGKFMLYRGVLSPEGQSLWKYYCFALDELKKIKALGPDGMPIDDSFIAEQKKCLQDSISEVG